MRIKSQGQDNWNRNCSPVNYGARSRMRGPIEDSFDKPINYKAYFITAVIVGSICFSLFT